MIDIVEGRTKESVHKIFKKLTKDQRDEVKKKYRDMWDAIIYGAKKHFKKPFIVTTTSIC